MHGVPKLKFAESVLQIYLFYWGSCLGCLNGSYTHVFLTVLQYAFCIMFWKKNSCKAFHFLSISIGHTHFQIVNSKWLTAFLTVSYYAFCLVLKKIPTKVFIFLSISMALPHGKTMAVKHLENHSTRKSGSMSVASHQSWFST